jgi:hypothetical protein
MITLGRSHAASLAMTAMLLWTLALAPQGCWWRGRHGHAAADSPASQADVTLQVTNHNYLDVIVYVIHDGQRSRIGSVTGSSAQVFTLPARLLGQGYEIRLYGDAIGSDDFALTELLLVHPGQYVEWTLETALARSSVGVY